MKPLHLSEPDRVYRAAGRRRAHVADVLRRPSRSSDRTRRPDRRDAITALRARYRPAPRLLRNARAVVICIGVALLFAVVQQRDPYVAYPTDPSSYERVLALLRAECGDQACAVTLDLGPRHRGYPSPELVEAMHGLGLRTAAHDPRVGDSRFATRKREQTVLHRSPSPTADQLRLRRNRERVWGAHETSTTGWTLWADGWFTPKARQ